MVFSLNTAYYLAGLGSHKLLIIKWFLLALKFCFYYLQNAVWKLNYFNLHYNYLTFLSFWCSAYLTELCTPVTASASRRGGLRSVTTSNLVVPRCRLSTYCTRAFSVAGPVYCWLGLLTCKNRLPYNLYCVGWDVKHCTIQSNPSLLEWLSGLFKVVRSIVRCL